jgi:hypothetical protein
MPKYQVTVTETLEEHYYTAEIEAASAERARAIGRQLHDDDALGDPHQQETVWVDVVVDAIGADHPVNPLSNDVLCDWAARALDCYNRQAEGHRVLTDEGAFPLLMASMMHLAKREGWDFKTMLRQARDCYRAERDEVRQSQREHEEVGQ